ncbi:hypothetical protein N2W52_001990 [Clostridium perfringens]|nr:hypothetical protein [Clostridium perfringens]MDK0983007.1 hypothetical protein [Clostridium perfringens]
MNKRVLTIKDLEDNKQSLRFVMYRSVLLLNGSSVPCMQIYNEVNDYKDRETITSIKLEAFKCNRELEDINLFELDIEKLCETLNRIQELYMQLRVFLNKYKIKNTCQIRGR